MGSVPASGRSPGGGHGNPLLYSCLKNPMDRGIWQNTAHRVAESNMTKETECTHKYLGRQNQQVLPSNTEAPMGRHHFRSAVSTWDTELGTD